MHNSKLWLIPIWLCGILWAASTAWFLIDKSVEVGRLWFIPAILILVFINIYRVVKNKADGISPELAKVERYMTFSFVFMTLSMILMGIHWCFMNTSPLGLIGNVSFIIAAVLSTIYSKKKKALFIVKKETMKE